MSAFDAPMPSKVQQHHHQGRQIKQYGWLKPSKPRRWSLLANPLVHQNYLDETAINDLRFHRWLDFPRFSRTVRIHSPPILRRSLAPLRGKSRLMSQSKEREPSTQITASGLRASNPIRRGTSHMRSTFKNCGTPWFMCNGHDATSATVAH
jgi:hypothetical protein